MARARFSAAARRDLSNILGYIANESGSATTARSFVRRLQEKCDDLAALPGTIGASRPELADDLRSYAFKGYVIFFCYEGDILRVITVLQGQRDVLSYFESDD
ncbi:type II toxin-antitoxin system RelE/ParE family toxin [Methylopila henanensis]|uniref:Type II toxin-antitoxin system RelE/ParE family toxin n=1 Tax=Methylopila henanensis TaxID=873516 RepID=A0ABW4KB53_9HYPH